MKNWFLSSALSAAFLYSSFLQASINGPATIDEVYDYNGEEMAELIRMERDAQNIEPKSMDDMVIPLVGGDLKISFESPELYSSHTKNLKTAGIAIGAGLAAAATVGAVIATGGLAAAAIGPVAAASLPTAVAVAGAATAAAPGVVAVASAPALATTAIVTSSAVGGSVNNDSEYDSIWQQATVTYNYHSDHHSYPNYSNYYYLRSTAWYSNIIDINMFDNEALKENVYSSYDGLSYYWK